jgi:hypothetical protein
MHFLFCSTCRVNFNISQTFITVIKYSSHEKLSVCHWCRWQSVSGENHCLILDVPIDIISLIRQLSCIGFSDDPDCLHVDESLTQIVLASLFPTTAPLFQQTTSWRRHMSVLSSSSSWHPKHCGQTTATQRTWTASALMHPQSATLGPPPSNPPLSYFQDHRLWKHWRRHLSERCDRDVLMSIVLHMDAKTSSVDYSAWSRLNDSWSKSKDYYKVVGVARDADQATFKKA